MPGVAEYYDTLDPLYRVCWSTSLHHGWFESGTESVAVALASYQDQLVRRLQVQSGQCVCDLGCGHGDFARHLAKTRGARVTGVTLSHGQAARSMENGIAGVDIIHRDWLENRLPSKSFDRLIAIESLYHIPRKPAALIEISRVLRTGGKAVLTLWIGEPGSWVDRGMRAWHPEFGGLETLDTYGKWIAAAGLVLDDAEDCTSLVRPTMAALARSAAAALWTEPVAFRFAVNSPWAACRLAIAGSATAGGYATGSLRYFVATITKREQRSGLARLALSSSN